MSLNEYKIISRPQKTEFERFASWFHQDWKLFFSSFDQGAKKYIDSLPTERKCLLRDEISHFLENNSKNSNEQTKELWLQLGAQGVPKDLDLRLWLADVVGTIHNDCN